MKFTLTANVVEINKKLKALENIDTTPLMEEIAGHMLESSEGAFTNQADPETGDAWQPLQEAYATWKRENGYSNEMLHLSGELGTTLVSEHDEKKARVGSILVYAGTMNFGFDENGLHARRFLGIDAIAKENIMEAIKKAYAKPLES